MKIQGKVVSRDPEDRVINRISKQVRREKMLDKMIAASFQQVTLYLPYLIRAKTHLHRSRYKKIR